MQLAGYVISITDYMGLHGTVNLAFVSSRVICNAYWPNHRIIMIKSSSQSGHVCMITDGFSLRLVGGD